VDVRVICLSSIAQFATVKDDFLAIYQWVKEGVGKGESHLDVPIKVKYSLVVAIYGCPFYFIDEKNALKELASKDDKSDDATRLEYGCNAANPDPKNKEKIWEWYLSKDKKVSADLKIASFMAFFHSSQDLSEYVTKFFKDIPTLMDDSTIRRVADAFFVIMCPKGKDETY